MTTRTAFALPTLFVAVLATWLALAIIPAPSDAIDLTVFGQALVTLHVLLTWFWCGSLARAGAPAGLWIGGAGMIMIPAPLYSVALLTGALDWHVTAVANLVAAAAVVLVLGGGRRLGARLTNPAVRRLTFLSLQVAPVIALWALRPLWLPPVEWPT